MHLAILIIGVLLGLFVLFAVGFIMYFFIYKAHANKALKEDGNAPGKSLPAPGKTASSLTVALVTLATILNAVSLVVLGVTVKDMGDRNDEKNNNYDRKIRFISEDVEELQDKTANDFDFLYSVKFEPGDFHKETGIFEINVTVDPKITSAPLVSGGFGGELTGFTANGDGTYSGVVGYRYIEDTEEQTLAIRMKSGETEFEERVTVSNSDVTGMFFISVEDRSCFTFRKEDGSFNVTGNVNLIVNGGSADHKISEASLHVTVNGEEKYGGIIAENMSDGSIWVDQIKEFTVSGKSDGDVEIYVRIVGDDGYAFEIPCSYYVDDESGDGSHGKIYSGNLVTRSNNIIRGNGGKNTVARIYLPDGARIK